MNNSEFEELARVIAEAAVEIMMNDETDIYTRDEDELTVLMKSLRKLIASFSAYPDGYIIGTEHVGTMDLTEAQDDIN